MNKELQQNLLKEFQISNSIQTMNVGKIFSERVKKLMLDNIPLTSSFAFRSIFFAFIQFMLLTITTQLLDSRLCAKKIKLF